MLVILKNTKMENNQVEWIMIKKISKKENRKTIRKFLFQGALFFALSYATLIFALNAMVWFWHSEFLNEAATWLRYIIK